MTGRDKIIQDAKRKAAQVVRAALTWTKFQTTQLWHWTKAKGWPNTKRRARHTLRWMDVTRRRWWGPWIMSAARATESPRAFTFVVLLVIGGLIGLRIGPHISVGTSTVSPAGAMTEHDETAKTGPPEPESPSQLTTQPVENNATKGPRLGEATRYKLKRGETLVNLLQRARFKRGTAHRIANAMALLTDMRRLRTGTQFNLASMVTPDGDQTNSRRFWFRAAFHEEIWVSIEPGEKRPTISAETRTLDTINMTSAGSGVINTSLYIDGKKAGVPDAILDQVINLMAFSVDFQRDIRAGDTFDIFFERRYSPKYGDTKEGQLLFSKLTLRGTDHEASYFIDPEDGRGDFYDSKGASARRTLMKTPVDGARLSSRYGLRRHPVLGYRTTHKGLDFAAPKGTPIKAAGDGVIERANRYSTFGNYVRIRHGSGFKTVYAHLNGFAKGIRKGKKVRQGDIIGYVGRTGRVTGVHLHYEVHKDGKPINPSTLKSPRARQLKGANLDLFKAFHQRQIASFQATLETMARDKSLGRPLRSASLKASPPLPSAARRETSR